MQKKIEKRSQIQNGLKYIKFSGTDSDNLNDEDKMSGQANIQPNTLEFSDLVKDQCLKKNKDPISISIQK